ncbi:hypothetical protein FB45DRAFT_875881 [Roridomyces roridus]|uniref:Uncharacterized protein n=1 Tax=Roridomyces roridus TaxID=1738132 RepID=A0AAD7B426_9AGAR|nr:hypothetical protein FB45DRAFT_875881 [Roridomyces roridus]
MGNMRPIWDASSPKDEREMNLTSSALASNFTSYITPKLRSLEVFALRWSEELLEFFRLCPRNSQLQEITFKTELTPCTVDVTVLNNAAESLLCDLPSLQTVEIRMSKRHDDVADPQSFLEWAETTRASLYSLESRVCLSIQCQDALREPSVNCEQVLAGTMVGNWVNIEMNMRETAAATPNLVRSQSQPVRFGVDSYIVTL